ncbi:hypothetical protein F5884DRAFT_853740 [Xylogone sp. PMI_703]|nr:hypothetical protein F5884DRAFT_853740 [Xylogone sp. PMI_703]
MSPRRDQGVPTCGRCKAAGRECVRSYTYRFHQDRFARDQTWLNVPKRLSFVDETQAAHDGDLSSSIPEQADSSSDFEGLESQDSPSESHPHHGEYEPTPPQSRTSDHSPVEYSKDGTSSETHSITRSQTPYQQQLSLNSKHSTHHRSSSELNFSTSSNRTNPTNANIPRSQIYSDQPIWPLKNSSEALLLRHYVQNLATWLDLCDPKRHFEVYVPQRAATCSILLNAIFALSARHLSLTSNYDRFASERYHQECLKSLIPMLNQPTTISDENLFAATIILRVLEEIDVTTAGRDTMSHMLGIQIFVNARDPNDMPGSLSEAAFWVGLRQEIYNATMFHQSLRLNLEHCSIDRSFKPCSDFDWANRAVVHCADVLNFCFGDMALSVPKWTSLKEYNKRWQASKPQSFTPIYYSEANPSIGQVFPQIWHQQSCHVIGIQHHIFAELLLALFDPTIPKLGLRRKSALQSMEDQVRSSLRNMCGIALWNRWMPPGMFTASMGIAICGDRFEDRIDQEALLDILVKTEGDHARPTAAVQQQMMKLWGWIPDD